MNRVLYEKVNQNNARPYELNTKGPAELIFRNLLKNVGIIKLEAGIEQF